MKNDKAKKQLMYLSGEDFYLFCYSIFIILDSLGCVSGKIFRDYRKLAFLINILNDEKLIYILSSVKGGVGNAFDKERLVNSYSTGLMKRSEILKLCFTLEKKRFLTLERGKDLSEINVSLNKTAIPNSFFNKDIFSAEYEIAAKIKKHPHAEQIEIGNYVAADI